MHADGDTRQFEQTRQKHRYRRFAHPVVEPGGGADVGLNDGPDHSKPQHAQMGTANHCIDRIKHPENIGREQENKQTKCQPVQ